MGGKAFKLGQKGGEAKEAGTAGGQVGGNGVHKDHKPKVDDAGNMNKPGGNAGKSAFKKNEGSYESAKNQGAKTTAGSAGAQNNKSTLKPAK
jgi:hypothetical protein